MRKIFFKFSSLSIAINTCFVFATTVTVQNKLCHAIKNFNERKRAILSGDSRKCCQFRQE